MALMPSERHRSGISDSACTGRPAKVRAPVPEVSMQATGSRPVLQRDALIFSTFSSCVSLTPTSRAGMESKPRRTRRARSPVMMSRITATGTKNDSSSMSISS